MSAESTHSAKGELYGYLAEFKTPGELIAAAKKVRAAGFTKWDCYSPFPVHGLDPAMGIRMTILPWIVFAVGLCGLGGGLLLQWWTNAHYWPWIVSGKPFWSIPANIPIAFETTILASVFAAFFGMWALNKLPQWWHPLFRSERFRKVSDDGFFIGVEARDGAFDPQETRQLLEAAGAVAVEACHLDPSPLGKRMPRPIFAFIIVSSVLALVPFALIAKARASKSTEPHWHLIPDMDDQPKYKSQRAAPTEIFANQRASRVPVAGTVARNELKADDHFYRGLVDGQWAQEFPPALEINMRTMARGEQNFDTYCAPCHGYDGGGNGMIHRRALQVPQVGWVPPANVTDAPRTQQPVGQLFNTISHGYNTMPGYASQIPESDRWAIILYLRALQRAQN